MKTTENYLAELREIRKMMHDSSRFLSLSGLSGILIGLYALAGAGWAHTMLIQKVDPFTGQFLVPQFLFLAIAVLAVSVLTVVLLTRRRVNKTGAKAWNPGSRLLLINLLVPLLTGGILILIFLLKGLYEFILPATLIFYGLALTHAAKFTRQEIFYLGLLQISLGILAVSLPDQGLVLWAVGFGLLHIVYGSLMYFRYEHNTKS